MKNFFYCKHWANFSCHVNWFLTQELSILLNGFYLNASFLFPLEKYNRGWDEKTLSDCLEVWQVLYLLVWKKVLLKCSYQLSSWCWCCSESLEAAKIIFSFFSLQILNINLLTEPIKRILQIKERMRNLQFTKIPATIYSICNFKVKHFWTINRFKKWCSVYHIILEFME